MFVINTPVVFTINRAKNASPAPITLVRLYKPDGDIDEINIVVNTLPTNNIVGLLTFNYTPTMLGIHKFEILKTTTPFMLMHIVNIAVVSDDSQYSTTIYV